jgi:hypothetical protein
VPPRRRKTVWDRITDRQKLGAYHPPPTKTPPHGTGGGMTAAHQRPVTSRSRPSARTVVAGAAPGNAANPSTESKHDHNRF